MKVFDASNHSSILLGGRVHDFRKALTRDSPVTANGLLASGSRWNALGAVGFHFSP